MTKQDLDALIARYKHKYGDTWSPSIDTLLLLEALTGTANEPSGGLPIRHPGDEMKIYSCPFDSFMPIAFRPGWIIKRMWKEGEKLCFIAGPAEAPSPERTSADRD